MPRGSFTAFRTAARRLGRAVPSGAPAVWPAAVWLTAAVGAAACLWGASTGPAAAQTFLDGRTLQEAPPFVVKRYRDRAEAGDLRAQFYLGLMYEQGLIGRSGPQPDVARDWFARAADGGYPPAQYKLGVYREDGIGGPVDQPAARELYLAAAGAGSAEAQYNLALMLKEGRGGPRDVREAIRWFEQAALAGVADAALALAEVQSAGVGTPVDLVEAWAWLSRAVGQGNAEAASLLTKLEAQMSDAQKAEARKLKQAHDVLAQMRRRKS